MNRTLLLLLAVLLLGCAAWFALSTKDDGSSVSNRGTDRQFSLFEFGQVDRIFIADRQDHKVSLTRGGVTGWLADGEPANENILKNLISALRSVDIKTLPTQKAIPNMVKDLATNGILVQLFNKEGTKLRGFYIGGGTHDELGTYAIMEGSENPYVVHQPHFSGNIRARFNHWGDEWRDRVYFRVNPDKVEQFSIEYPIQKDKSFRLERDGANYKVMPFYGTSQPTLTVSRGIVEGAMSRYEKYYVNRYENGDTESIKEAKTLLPFAIITVKQEGQEAKTMEVYPRYKNQTFSNDAKSGEEIINGGLNAFTAFINGGQDWVLLNVETTQPLLVAYDYFR